MDFRHETGPHDMHLTLDIKHWTTLSTYLVSKYLVAGLCKHVHWIWQLLQKISSFIINEKCIFCP